jgi:hypothetical protein
MMRRLSESICSVAHIEPVRDSTSEAEFFGGSHHDNFDAVDLCVIAQRDTLIREINPDSVESDLRDATRDAARVLYVEFIGRCTMAIADSRADTALPLFEASLQPCGACRFCCESNGWLRPTGCSRPCVSVICIFCSHCSNSGARFRPSSARRYRASWNDVLW